MSRTRRTWVWIGGVWLALVVGGGGATLALQPDDPSPGGSPGGSPGHSPRDSHGGTPSSSPGAGPAEVEDGCEDEEAEARRRAERKGQDSYAYICITAGERGR